MGKLQKNESGFSVVEAVLVVVIVALIGTVGWLLYKNHHKTTTSATKPTTSTSTKTTTTPTPISTTAVTQLVTTFYNQYMACFSAGNLNQTCTTNLVNQDGTSTLYSYYKPAAGYSYPADPIMCAQDNPSSISVSGVTSTVTSASGIVTEAFTPPDTINFTVVNQSGGLKINTIACNPAMVASQGSP